MSFTLFHSLTVLHYLTLFHSLTLFSFLSVSIHPVIHPLTPPCSKSWKTRHYLNSVIIIINIRFSSGYFALRPVSNHIHLLMHTTSSPVYEDFLFNWTPTPKRWYNHDSLITLSAISLQGQTNTRPGANHWLGVMIRVLNGPYQQLMCRVFVCLCLWGRAGMCELHWFRGVDGSVKLTSESQTWKKNSASCLVESPIFRMRKVESLKNKCLTQGHLDIQIGGA